MQKITDETLSNLIDVYREEWYIPDWFQSDLEWDVAQEVRDIYCALVELQEYRTSRGNFDPQLFWDSIPTEDSPVWPVACVDVNGVLDVYTGWSGKVEMFPLAEGAREFLVRLREHFNTIILLTATMPVSMVEKWVEENGLSDLVAGVTNHKVPADVYLDDRAITFIGNYDLALEEMINFIPHWKVVEE